MWSDVKFLSLQELPLVDFTSWNDYADPNFRFYDQDFLDKCRGGRNEVCLLSYLSLSPLLSAPFTLSPSLLILLSSLLSSPSPSLSPSFLPFFPSPSHPPSILLPPLLPLLLPLLPPPLPSSPSVGMWWVLQAALPLPHCASHHGNWYSNVVRGYWYLWYTVSHTDFHSNWLTVCFFSSAK